MMKEKFQFYKNIILVVASALTLVAVTFAWFSTSNKNTVSSIQRTIGSELINVTFFEETAPNTDNYTRMSGDIVLDGMVSGEYSKYKMAVTTFTNQPLNLTFAIDGLSNVSSQFLNAVEVKYSLYKAVKNANGTFSETGNAIFETNDYVKLSQFAESTGVVFNRLLTAYQTTDRDYFVIKYEIGVAGGATEIQGLSSNLGSVKVSAQLAAG